MQKCKNRIIYQKKEEVGLPTSSGERILLSFNPPWAALLPNTKAQLPPSWLRVHHSSKTFKVLSAWKSGILGKCDFQMRVWIICVKTSPTSCCAEPLFAASCTSGSSYPWSSTIVKAMDKWELLEKPVISPEFSQICIIMQVEEKPSHGWPAKQSMSSKAALYDVYHL